VIERGDIVEPLTRHTAPLWRLVAVGACLVVLTALGPLLHWRLGGMAHWAVVALTAAGAGWAALSSDALDRKASLVVIGLVAIAMRLVLLPVEPYLSDDIYRYVWDGRVQAAGINPYRYIPAALELERLRDVEIFARINRADYAHTIYPPTAQMLFLVITRLGESALVMRLGLVACEAIAIVATLLLLIRLRLPPTRIAAFAWHPLAAWEIAGNGHVDAAMLAFLLPAMLAFLGGRALLAAVLVATAALVKPVAALALPVLWRPWDLRLPAMVGATLLLLYAPYLSVGSGVLGFLPEYVKEEEFSHGTGFRYLMIAERLVGPLPGAAGVYAIVAVAVMLVLALHVGFRRDRSEQASIGALTLLATTFLVLLTPHYPWYYLVLVPLLAIHPRSWTLWLLTVGGMQTYQAVPSEIMPDYVDRQIVFHILVLATIARDLAVAPPRRLWTHARPPIRSTPT
jgi:hypothetical protein